MAKYQAKPVIVDAFKITDVDLQHQTGWGDQCLAVTLENGKREIATAEMTVRMTPTVGDYWVIQEDGYTYLNPKDVFLRKYGPIEPNALELGAEVRRAGLAGD